MVAISPKAKIRGVVTGAFPSLIVLCVRMAVSRRFQKNVFRKSCLIRTSKKLNLELKRHEGRNESERNAVDEGGGIGSGQERRGGGD